VRELHHLALGAIVTLPAEQHQAVRLHDLDGLMLGEVGRLAGVSMGTIEVRLHRARAQLRREVARRMAGVPASFPGMEEVNAMYRCLLGRVISSVTLVHKRHFDGFARDLLHRSRQVRDLGAVLCIRRRDMPGQQVTQGINCHRHCAAVCAFRPIIAGSVATFRAVLPRPTIKDRRRGLFRAPIRQPQEHTSIVNDGFEHTRLQPTLGLLIHRLPWRQPLGIIRHGTPARAIQRRP
jgi:hypothetical protein